LFQETALDLSAEITIAAVEGCASIVFTHYQQDAEKRRDRLCEVAAGDRGNL